MRRDSRTWKFTFVIQTLTGIENYEEMVTLLGELTMQLKQKGYKIIQHTVEDAEDEDSSLR